jgi:hypothetical protein
VVEAPRTFVIEIVNFDFELHTIRIRHTDGTVVANEEFLLMLFDSGEHQMMSAPVGVRYLSYSGNPVFGGCFPVPPILYPRTSLLRFDITSLVCNTDLVFPKTYSIEFDGIERIPCEPAAKGVGYGLDPFGGAGQPGPGGGLTPLSVVGSTAGLGSFRQRQNGGNRGGQR